MKIDSYLMQDAFQDKEYLNAALILAEHFDIPPSSVAYRKVRLFVLPGLRREILFRISDRRFQWNETYGFSWEWTGIYNQEIWVWENQQ